MTVRLLRGLCPAEASTADRDPNLAISRLRWAILLNSLFIALELGAGFAVNSLALLSDAWHNFTDVLGLGIAWFAVRQVRRPADSVRTFGYHRAGILADRAGGGPAVNAPLPSRPPSGAGAAGAAPSCPEAAR